MRGGGGEVSVVNTSHLFHVETTVGMSHTPDQVGRLEEQRHEKEDNRHPLVVGDLPFLPFLNLFGNDVLCGDVVGVGDPAIALRVLDVRSFRTK